MQTSIYIAGRFAQLPEINRLADVIEKNPNFSVVSRWHRIGKLHQLTDEEIEDCDERVDVIANNDLQDIMMADIFLNYVPDYSGKRGGRHFETGYALAKGKQVIIFGKPEHVFAAMTHSRIIRITEGDFAALLYAIERNRQKILEAKNPTSDL